MKASFVKFLENFLDDLDTFLMALLYMRFEYKLKRLERAKEKKRQKILQTQRDLEHVEKKIDNVVKSWKNIQQYGV